ncbi:uncharacterized protein LOC115888923 [Sitophilus oryzae]|uniref:Uncharacterized protein LOC115888923 n=1 Tax=Sitophilus oryzae TaxID=7048 RepID=A0A6J2YMN6_SITOR|nr:uncharacterized protein LOC115888923 [Sitophilus oryzae]
MAPTIKPALRSLDEKINAIQMVKSGKTKASVARQIGVPESTLRGWCKNQVRIFTQAINNCGLSTDGRLRQEEVLSPKSYESSSSSSDTHMFSSSISSQRSVSYFSGTEEFEDQPLDLSTNAAKSREPFTFGKNLVPDILGSRDIRRLEKWYSSGEEADTSNVTSKFFDENQPPSFFDWYRAPFCTSGNNNADLAAWQEALVRRMYAGRQNQHQSYEEWCEAAFSTSSSNADVTTTPKEPIIQLYRYFWKWYATLLSNSKIDGANVYDNISVISDPEVNISKREAIRHGERFLTWLKVCGKDTVTTDEFFALHDLLEHLKNKNILVVNQ